MVEGVRHLLDDKPENTIQIVHYVGGAEMNDAIPLFNQISLAFLIPLGTIPKVVRTSIDFDHEAGIADEEIRDIGPDRMLAANLEAKLAATKLVPQQYFGRRHPAAQLARYINGRFA